MKKYKLAKLQNPLSRRFNRIGGGVVLAEEIYVTVLVVRSNPADLASLLLILLPMISISIIMLSGYWPKCWHPSRQ